MRDASFYRRLHQRRYHLSGAPQLDTDSAPQTVELAPRAKVSRDVLARLDIDPGVTDAKAELSERRPRLRAYPNAPLLCSRVPGGTVATSAGIVLTEDGRWFRESVWPASVGIAVETSWPQRIRVGAARYVDEDVAVIYSHFSDKKLRNYHHWTIEGITRAAMLERAGVPKTVRILVPTPAKDQHFRTLEAIGIERERLLEWTGEPTRFRTVYFPTGPQHRGRWPNAAALGYIRDDAVKHAGGVPVEPTRRLWVSRRQAWHRRMPGEDRLVEVAERFEFEEVFAEQLDPVEQLALFASAQIVAGPHGAGLANAAYMQPGGMVIEAALESLKPRTKPVFWNLAAAGGQRYACGVGPERGVDPGRFADLLARVLS